MLLSIFRDQKGVSLLIFNRNTVIYEVRAVSQPRGKYIEYKLILNPAPWLLESRVKPCGCSHKDCGPTRTNRIKIAFKVVRMEVNLFSEQSLFIVMK